MPQGSIGRAFVDMSNPLQMGRRRHLRSMGFTDYDMGRPIIGVCNPWSELNPGHWHFKTLAEAVKRGIWAAGGFPLEFPTISMCEVFHNISTLIYRNLRNMGPVGAPGMPEVGPTGLPRHLLRQGVRDMARITDARMSGTSFGTIVLHVAPEAAIGGPLAIVQNSDMVELDAENGVLNLLVDEREIKRRLAAWRPASPKYEKGYRALWVDQVLQAPDGCDFAFCTEDNWLSKRTAVAR